MGADISFAAAMLLAALGAWQTLWQGMADQARAFLLDQPAATAAPSEGITIGGTSVRGSGSHPVLTVHDVVLHGEADGQAWDWRVGEVILSLHPNDVNRIEVTLPSPQRFRAAGPLGRTSLTLWSRNLGASLRLAPDGMLRHVEVAGDGLTLVAPNAEVSAAALALDVEPRADQSLGLAGVLHEIVLPEEHRLAAPLGGSVDTARVTAWVTGLTPEPPASGAAWRDAGGTIGLSEFTLDWGPFHLMLDGRAALDALLRPEGRFTVAASGLADALDSAHASNVIGDAMHRGIQRSLDQIGKLRGDGPADDIRISLAMAGGTLSWSGIPLARLPSFADPAVGLPAEAQCDPQKVELAANC